MSTDDKNKSDSWAQQADDADTYEYSDVEVPVLAKAKPKTIILSKMIGDASVPGEPLQPPEQDPEEDVHTCAKCKLLFTSLELYIQHKMTSKTCGKNFEESRSIIMKQFGPRRRGRPPGSGRKRQLHDNYGDTNKKPGRVPKTQKYCRLQLHHNQSDIIEETKGYSCSKCGRSFRREAALNRHMEYDHRERGSDESSNENNDEPEEDDKLVTTNDITKSPRTIVLADHVEYSKTMRNDINIINQGEPQIELIETLTLGDFDEALGGYTVLTSDNQTIILREGETVQLPPNVTVITDSNRGSGGPENSAGRVVCTEEIVQPQIITSSGNMGKTIDDCQALEISSELVKFAGEQTMEGHATLNNVQENSISGFIPETNESETESQKPRENMHIDTMGNIIEITPEVTQNMEEISEELQEDTIEIIPDPCLDDLDSKLAEDQIARQEELLIDKENDNQLSEEDEVLTKPSNVVQPPEPKEQRRQEMNDPDFNPSNMKMNYLDLRKKAVKSLKRLEKKEQTYPCQHCGRVFSVPAILRAHLLTHSEERNFRCKIPTCPFAFKTKGSLVRHMRRHTGERPFKCKLCGRAFRESGALTRHLKSRGMCTDKTDSDFPRYKKNLHMNVDMSKVQAKRLLAKEDLERKKTIKLQPKVIKVQPIPSTSSDIITIRPIEKRPDGQQIAKHQLITGAGGLSDVIFVPVSADKFDLSSLTDAGDHQMETPEGMEAVLTPGGGDLLGQGEMIMTVASEEALNAHQGLSMEVVNEQEADNLLSEQDILANPPEDTLSEQSLDINLLEQEDGEIQYESEVKVIEEVEIKSGEIIMEEQIIGKNDSEVDDLGPGYICKVDHQIFRTKEELVQHLKSHMLNVHFHCDLCNYFTNSRERMEEHVQITHLKMWVLPEHSTDNANNTNSFGNIPSYQDPMRTDQASNFEQPNNIETITSSHNTDHMSHDGHVTDPANQQKQHVTMKTINLDAVRSTDEKTFFSQDLTNLDPAGEEEFTSLNLDDMKASQQSAGTIIAQKALDQLLLLQNDSGPKLLESQTKPVCPVCGKTFKGHSYLKQHVKKHTGEKQNQCPFCGKAFYTKDALHKHFSTHSHDRNYKCGECGKMFKRISHVREHLKVHSNDRPYPCKVCFKTFKSVNACKVHMRIHSDVMQYKCQYCMKYFREKGSLERHVRTHTGDKPYSCQHCGRKFAEHGTLNRHLKAKVPCTRELQQMRLAKQTDGQPPDTVNPGDFNIAALGEQDEDSTPTNLADSESDNLHAQYQEQGILGNEPQLQEAASAIKLENLQEATEAEIQTINLTIHPDGQIEENLRTGVQPVVKSEESSVLTEFSSVVADTQQYIVQDQLQGDPSFVTITNEDAATILHQNIEVIAEGSEEAQDIEYIVMEQGNSENVVFIDQKTGQPVQLMPTGTPGIHMLPSGEQIQLLPSSESQMQLLQTEDQITQVIEMMPDKTLETTDAGVAMVSGEEIVAMETDSGYVNA